MKSLNRAITTAAQVLADAISTESPEVDTRLLPRRVQELVHNVIQSNSSASVQITASVALPKVNQAADIIAYAFTMFQSGDKVNAGKLMTVAFNSPDCYELITAMSDLNEDADPEDLESVIARINKGEIDDNGVEVYSDPSSLSQADVVPLPAGATNTADTTPMSEDDDEDNTGLTDQNAAGDDAINLGEPVENNEDSKLAMSVLSDLNLIPQGNSDVMDAGDAAAGHDDSDISNVQDDPSSLDLNPANWNLNDDEPMGGDALDMSFEETSVPMDGNAPGIDQTAQGTPNTESDFGDLDSELGMSPAIDPQAEIIASITDSVVRGVINKLYERDTPKSRSQITAFLNEYARRREEKKVA